MHYLKRILSFVIVIQIFICSPEIHAKEDWKRVYLATYPRSGNHWMRNLIEEATHIATSSVYLDKEPMHLTNPFPWGGYAPENGYEGNCRYPNPGEIVVIKTHFPAKPKSEFDLQPAVKVIRIVRHPIDAFHSHFIHQRHKLPPEGKIPKWYVKRSVKNWRKFEKYWNKQPDVLTIRYEDLLNNPRFYFQEVLKAAGYNLREEDIKRALAKFPPQGGVLIHLNDYHPEDLKFISRKLGRLMKKYDYKLGK
jgi:Sulfotransferase domain